MTDTKWTHTHTFTLRRYPFGWVWFLSQLKTEAEVRIG